MIVAGIDPGSLCTGYAFLQNEASKIKVLEYGVIRSKPALLLVDKLKRIFDNLSDLFLNYRPQHLALETAYVAKYPRAALVLGHTRGAVMVAACSHHTKVFEYEPRLIKKAVVGVGRASKSQVAVMIQKHLMLAELPKP
ncbi:crossover junction endodeoxyribonuclease RuvC, partial [Fibrobacterota bacterium]